MQEVLMRPDGVDSNTVAVCERFVDHEPSLDGVGKLGVEFPGVQDDLIIS